MRKALALILLLAAFGCATTPAAPPAPVSVMFNESEVAWSKGTGTGVVEGQAFLKTRGGDVKYGAGETVILAPASTYATEYVRRLIADGRRAPEIDERARALNRSTTADGTGRFRFGDLPTGEYIVVTSVTWQIPATSRYGSPSTQGGYVAAPVKVEAGKTATVVLTW